MQEIELNDNTYRVGKLDVFDQIKVARKIFPVLSSLGKSVSQMREEVDKVMSEVDEKLQEEEQAEPNLLNDNILDRILWTASSPIAEALNKLSDEDIDYILKKSLNVISRRDATTKKWTRILAGNGQPMFDDIDMFTMLRLTYEVVQENLGNFFPVPRQLNSEEPLNSNSIQSG